MLLSVIIALKSLATITEALMTVLTCYISSISRHGFWIYKVHKYMEMTETLLEVGTVFSCKLAEGSYGVEGFRLSFILRPETK